MRWMRRSAGTDRARKRGFTWSPQRSDGMRVGRLIATPELRANLDAWLARFATPGMCNPEDQTPCTNGQPVEHATNTDWRSHAQRQHDALNALVRGQLRDPKLGVHKGLPVTVIVSTTLKELTTGAGAAVTAGGTLLLMRDVIRMASHAYHYLSVFDDHLMHGYPYTTYIASSDGISGWLSCGQPPLSSEPTDHRMTAKMHQAMQVVHKAAAGCHRPDVRSSAAASDDSA